MGIGRLKGFDVAIGSAQTPPWMYGIDGLGMYSFILEEHKETYCIFYKEVTGKSLQTVSLVSSASTSGLKRKVQSVNKEEPRIKKSKSEQKVCVNSE